MNVSVNTADGNRFSVEVLGKHDPKVNEKIHEFLQEHHTHKITEHCCHNLSTEVQFTLEGGEFMSNPSKEVWDTNYEILVCMDCGITQDVTNGDFIFAGVTIS